ncbi:MAG: hypothetical protein ACPGSO_06900 [Vicingaceae bacterium]
MKKLGFEIKTTLATLILIITMSSMVNAQQVSQQMDFSSTICFDIEYFKVMKVDNQLYFKFLVIEEEDNSTYVLESSTNGKDFTPCQLKDGFKSPNKTALLYCFSEPVKKTNTQYRINRIQFKESVSNEYSQVITVKSNEPSRVWINGMQENKNSISENPTIASAN